VLRSHPDNISKVALHEYLHDIDGMFALAGHSEWFLSADDMARHMELLLGESPGAFEELGYSDSQMLELAAKEMKREASFPWRTQLVYYRWMLERTQPEHYLSVFPRLGRIEPRRKRQALYGRFILPEGAQPYQIAFDASAASGMRLGLATLSNTDDDYVNLERTVWAGTPQRSAEVRTYAEAEITAPEKTEIVLGEAGKELTVRVQRTGGPAAPVAEASVTGAIGEQSLDFDESSEGVYAASISELPQRETRITVTAEAAGLTISSVVVAVQARPSWTVSLPDRLSSFMGEPNQLDFSIDDASSDARFEAEAKMLPFRSDLTEALAADDYVQKALPDAAVEPHGFGNRYTLTSPALPPGVHTLELAITRKTGDEHVTFVHRCQVEVSSDGAEFVVDRDAAGQAVGYLAREGKPLPAICCVIYDNGIFAGPLPLDDAGHYRVPSGPVAETVRLLRGAELPVRAEVTPPETGALPSVPYYFLVARPLDKPPELDEVSVSDPLLSLDFTPEHINVLQGEYDGEDDASGKLGFGYDSEALYIWGVMKDDRMRDGGTWDSDRINFVFDALSDTTEWAYPEGPGGYNQWAADDYWVFVNLFQDKPAVTRMGGEAPGGGIGYWGAVADAKISLAKTDGGFKFILSLLLSSLPHLSAEPGAAAGFTCFYSDWDDAFTELMFFTRWPVEAGALVWTYWNPGMLHFAR